MTVGKALKEMLSTYAKKPLLFSGIFVVVMLPLFLIQYLVGAGLIFGGLATGNLGSLLGIGLVYIILMVVLGFVAGVLFFGGTVRATDKVIEGKSVGFGECLSYAFGKIWAYLGLALRVFWYSLAWLFILLLILYPTILNTIRSASAQLISPEDGPAMIASQGEPSMYGMASFFSGFSLVYVIVVLVVLVFVIIRSLKVMFSFYYLFDEDKITTKDALKKSIELTKGNLWRIIGYWLVITLLVAVIGAIIGSLTGPSMSITQMAETGYQYQVSTGGAIVNFVFQAIVSPMMLIYYFVFYKGLRSEKGMH